MTVHMSYGWKSANSINLFKRICVTLVFVTSPSTSAIWVPISSADSCGAQPLVDEVDK